MRGKYFESYREYVYKHGIVHIYTHWKFNDVETPIILKMFIERYTFMIGDFSSELCISFLGIILKKDTLFFVSEVWYQCWSYENNRSKIYSY